VDLNQPVDVDSIHLTIPANDITYADDMYVVITWKARYQTIVMDVNDTWFGNSSKTILRRTRKPELDIEMWYDPLIQDWRFIF
jgi:hypothetical protein